MKHVGVLRDLFALFTSQISLQRRFKFPEYLSNSEALLLMSPKFKLTGSIKNGNTLPSVTNCTILWYIPNLY